MIHLSHARAVEMSLGHKGYGWRMETLRESERDGLDQQQERN